MKYYVLRVLFLQTQSLQKLVKEIHFPLKLESIGVSPSGKAAVFGIAMRRFESFHPNLKKRGIMELLTSKREQNGKNDNKRLRRQRQIPAVVYGQGEAQSISIALNDFEAFLRKIPKGELSTARFSLAVDKEKVEVLVKDVQYAKTSYDILHLDFLKLDKKQLVTVNVPVRFTGQMACPGLKLGGVLRPVMRTVKIRCLPDQIPSHFEIDVSQLSLKQSKRVKDIQFSKDIRVVSKMDEVVGLIGKR